VRGAYHLVEMQAYWSFNNKKNKKFIKKERDFVHFYGLINNVDSAIGRFIVPG
jgi:hypothetical protein